MEITLGTNNTNVASNMGSLGRPGASLKSFRDFFSNSQLIGADIDREILFSLDRVKTYWVDQHSQSSLADLGKEAGDSCDLMIDDVLHAPSAKIHTLGMFLTRLKVGGFAVIEDIPWKTKVLWMIVASCCL